MKDRLYFAHFAPISLTVPNCKGGITTVIDNQGHFGYSVCSPLDNYEKKEGRDKAVDSMTDEKVENFWLFDTTKGAVIYWILEEIAWNVYDKIINSSLEVNSQEIWQTEIEGIWSRKRKDQIRELVEAHEKSMKILAEYSNKEFQNLHQEFISMYDKVKK